MHQPKPDSPLPETGYRKPKHTFPDLPDRFLLLSAAAATVATVLWFIVRQWLPTSWREPGSQELYLVGVLGLALLLAPVAYTLSKRCGGPNPKKKFNAHVLCSLAGMVLITIHSGGYVRRPPAMIIVLLIVLMVIGIWARVRGSYRIAATFATKAPSFSPPDQVNRELISDLILQKRALLQHLAPGANEGTFSVNLPHFARNPWLAFRYYKLAKQEANLLGVRAAVSSFQAWWRPLHIALALLFILSALVHVVTITFFAGYVANGGPITWWHLASW